ncbi:MAG: DUF2079 domain-containing protein [Actinomycetota bacterium]|nr:DUF2079 domain-containing protein [Actinomycetota bacterium]
MRDLGRARLSDAGPFAVAALAAVGLSAAAIFRHDHYGSNGYDLGIFDQTVWGYSRFESIPNTVLRLPNALGDHFHPILATLAPLYWIWEDARMLLIAQAVLIALAGLPIFFWAREELGTAAAYAFEVAYLVFWGVLGGDIFDFHELAFAAPIVSFALYATVTRRWRLLWAMAALGCLTREDVTLAFVGIGLYLLLQRRFRLGGALIAATFLWFIVAVKLVIPAFADRAYQQWYYTRLGDGPGEAALHVVLHPIDTIRLFFSPHDKLLALFNLFAPWLALPLASPLVVAMLPPLAARFLSDKPSHWAPQGFHYSLVLAPMLAFAAIDGAARVSRLLEGRTRLAPALLGALVLLAGLYFSFGRLRPLDELERYTSAAQIAAIETCLATIPPDASVSATSALVPHLSHRRRIYQLDRRPTPDTDYYALDASTWIFPLTRTDVRQLIQRKRRAGYQVRCARADTVVLGLR